jgi:hypothetical protein
MVIIVITDVTTSTIRPAVVSPLALAANWFRYLKICVELRGHQVIGEEALQRDLERREHRERGEQRERDRHERHEREHRRERQAARDLRDAVLGAAPRGELRETLEGVEIDGQLRQTFLLVDAARPAARAASRCATSAPI